jgi:hypothetical protein
MSAVTLCDVCGKEIAPEDDKATMRLDTFISPKSTDYWAVDKVSRQWDYCGGCMGKVIKMLDGLHK